MYTGLWRYFTNQTKPPFIEDPFHHIILEESGHAKEHEVKRKVGFQELFYDLFLVAALSVFSGDNDLDKGPDVGAYVVFFAALWAIWASQTVFDVRYGTKDGMMWIFGYLQLCVFGIFASVSGDFDLTLGFDNFEDNGKAPSEEEYHRITSLAHWVRRPVGEIKNEQATLRSLKAASATFAISRMILFVQYLVVLYYARKHRRSLKPIIWHLGGLLISAILWWSALAVSFSTSSEAAIARITLWTTGLAFEFACMGAAAATQPAYKLDLEYWAERFSALTLIVLGEGIISLFEAFQSVLAGVTTGVAAGGRGTVAGLIFSAIGLYRVLYYLYFGQHSHHIRGGAIGHGLWGCLHFPLHLAILLLTQCASHIIFATNLNLATDTITTAYINLMIVIEPAIESGNVTAVERALLLSPEAETMQMIFANIKINWYENVANLITHANGNLSLVDPLLTGETFSALSQLFTNYGFEPNPHTYMYINEALATGDPAAQPALLDESNVLLMKPVYVSMQYGFTVLGGVFVCLGLLSILQHGPAAFHNTHHEPHQKRPRMFYHKVSMFYRFALGIVLLLLSLLDIGPFWNNSDQTGPAAPIYFLLNGTLFLPILFLMSLSACILDFGMFLWRQHYVKEHHHQEHHTKELELQNNRESIRVLPSLNALPRLDSSESMGGQKVVLDQQKNDRGGTGSAKE